MRDFQREDPLSENGGSWLWRVWVGRSEKSIFVVTSSRNVRECEAQVANFRRAEFNNDSHVSVRCGELLGPVVGRPSQEVQP